MLAYVVTDRRRGILTVAQHQSSPLSLRVVIVAGLEMAWVTRACVGGWEAMSRRSAGEDESQRTWEHDSWSRGGDTARPLPPICGITLSTCPPHTHQLEVTDGFSHVVQL